MISLVDITSIVSSIPYGVVVLLIVWAIPGRSHRVSAKAFACSSPGGGIFSFFFFFCPPFQHCGCK